MVRLAGRRFFPMAQIHHVGRRFGKAYVTPTSDHVRGDVLLIGLPGVAAGFRILGIRQIMRLHAELTD